MTKDRDKLEDDGYLDWTHSPATIHTEKQAFKAGAAWQRKQQSPQRNWAGCRACFGSGGKKVDPCKQCNGTGKVPKDFCLGGGGGNRSLPIG